MKRKTVYFFLFIIIVITSVLRLWKLGDVPISPNWDEVALGYNAYSILETGRDEYGEFLPIILRSFDDYKPALYAYLIIPFIKILDVNVVAVRLPSVIFGVLTVLATYFLVKELFRNTSTSFWQANKVRASRISRNVRDSGVAPMSGAPQNDDLLPLLSSFLLAISPWHIQFSRIAFEANVGLSFNVFAVLFFLWGLKRPWLLLLSALMMGIGLYAYQSEKVFVPLLLLVLIIIFRKELFLLPKKYILMAGVLVFIVSLPIIYYTLTNREALSRAQDVSILANTTPLLEENVQRLIRDKERHDILGLILDNRRITYFKTVVASYLSHFDLNWLFIKGDIARHHAPSMGILYIWELPFLLIGIYGLLLGSFSRKIKILIFSWFLIAPIPASVTSDVPHAVRTLNFLPTFQIFTTLGLVTAVSTILNIKNQILKIQIKYLIFALYILFLVFNISYYFNQYFVQQNYFHAKYWQYGYKEIVEYLMPVHNKYNKIIVSNTQPLDQSYIFFLFYSTYDPVKYLAEGGTKSGIQEESGNKFLNFEFRPFNYYEEDENNILMVGSPSDLKEIFKTIKRVDYPNGDVAIRVVHKD